MNDDLNAKLDSLVGIAVKALCDAGAKPADIGSFAASYRAQAAKILGGTDIQPEPPDLLTLVTQAVRDALSSDAAPVRNETRQPKAIRFNLIVHGRRTSVTIPSADAQRLMAEHGGRKQAVKQLEQIAQVAPKKLENRSAWIVERLHHLWDGATLPADDTLRH